MQLIRTFRKYFLPGLIFQSLIIAGGYGTGREIVEFFLNYGPAGGLLAMVLVSTTIWCGVCAITFELARITQAYDYRTFSQQLLGRAWFMYELCYMGIMLLILSVIAAAAGSILEELASIPYSIGVVGMMASVGFLVFHGTKTIEKFFTVWSFVLYAVYIVFLAWNLSHFGNKITQNLASLEILPNWYIGGIEYAAYNVGILPAVLFCIRHIETRREAIVAGLLAGPLGILPGMFFLLAMIGQYPEVLSQTVPSNYLLEIIGSRTFQVTFQIVLLGTLIETGTGLIHAFNERVSTTFQEQGRTMPAALRLAVAVGLLAIGALTAQFGLIDLIAKGYGTITYGFWIVYLLPVFTLGVWKILKSKRTQP